MKKNLLNAVTGVLFASLFIFLTFRDKPLDEIISLIRETKTNWIILGAVMLPAVFLTRAIRWRILIINAGEKASLKNVSYSLLLGFFVNSFTPKLGEIIRCTSLQKGAGIAVSKSLGTVVSERVYDILVLLAGVLLIIFVEFGRLRELLSSTFSRFSHYLSDNIPRLIIFIFVIILILYAIWFLTGKFGFREKTQSFFTNMYTTIKMTFRIRKSLNFTIHTILMWLFMILLNYCCLKALPSTENLSFYFATVVLFVGSIGWAIPSPGGIGTSHFFVLQLFLLFGLNESTGIAYALLVNGVTVLFTICAGLLAIIAVNVVRFASRGKINYIF